MSVPLFSPDMIFSEIKLFFHLHIYPWENTSSKYMLYVRTYKSFQISHKLLYIISSERVSQCISKLQLTRLQQIVIISTYIAHDTLKLIDLHFIPNLFVIRCHH